MASAVKNEQTTLSIEDKRLLLVAATVFFMVIGGLMVLFATTFIRDIATLRSVPDAVWNFLCGTPTDNNVTLPLLLTIAIVCFGVSCGLMGWHWLLGRKMKVNG